MRRRAQADDLRRQADRSVVAVMGDVAEGDPDIWDRVLNLSLIPVTLLGAGVMVYRLRGAKTVTA